MQDIKHSFLCIWQRKETKDCHFILRFMPKYVTNPLKWDPILHTYIPLTLYPRRGSRGISNIPPRHPRFTKISKLFRASEGTLSRWSRLHLQSLAHPLQFQGGLTTGRRPVVKIIAESISQHDEKHVVPTLLSRIRVGRRSKLWGTLQAWQVVSPSPSYCSLISGVSANNPLVAFYDMHGGKRKILLFCPAHHTRHPIFSPVFETLTHYLLYCWSKIRTNAPSPLGITYIPT
jgi:hypothetical protein